MSYDSKLIEMRKKGKSCLQLVQERQKFEPFEDDLISLNHVVRVCHESSLPFTSTQVRRVFNKIYNKDFHGQKLACWNFLKQWFGRKLILFRNVGSRCVKNKQISPKINSLKRVDEFKIKPKICAENGGFG